MATATTALAWTNSSAANFRGWGKWMSDQFAAFGWVLVYQNFATGTDWTDVSAPTLTNDVEVTEIWRMDDSLQASAPLFLKIEYGSGSSANNPALRVNIGTGHDGAGNLTGALSSETTMRNGIANANSMTHYASGDTDRIMFAMAVDGSGWALSGQYLFSIERRIDGTGAPVGTGFLMLYAGGSTRGMLATLASGTGPVTLATFNCTLPSVSLESQYTFDSKMAVGPFAWTLGPAELGLGAVGIPTSAYTQGATLSVSLFGSSHTYVAVGTQANFVGIIGVASTSTVRPAMRYE